MFHLSVCSSAYFRKRELWLAYLAGMHLVIRVGSRRCAFEYTFLLYSERVQYEKKPISIFILLKSFHSVSQLSTKIALRAHEVGDVARNVKVGPLGGLEITGGSGAKGIVVFCLDQLVALDRPCPLVRQAPAREVSKVRIRPSFEQPLVVYISICAGASYLAFGATLIERRPAAALKHLSTTPRTVCSK